MATIRTARELRQHLRQRQAAIQKAEKRSITRTLSKSKTLIKREIKPETGLKTKVINRLLKTYKRFKNGVNRGRIWASDYAPNLAEYSHRIKRTKRKLLRRGPRTLGVIVREKPGSKDHYKRGFAITTKRGKRLLFNRKSNTQVEPLRGKSVGEMVGAKLNKLEPKIRKELKRQFEMAFNYLTR